MMPLGLQNVDENFCFVLLAVKYLMASMTWALEAEKSKRIHILLITPNPLSIVTVVYKENKPHKKRHQAIETPKETLLSYIASFAPSCVYLRDVCVQFGRSPEKPERNNRLNSSQAARLR